MFSKDQKHAIASNIAQMLLSLEHPEMPTEQPLFTLQVYGKTPVSYAVIEPNWTFDANNPPGVNPHNEAVAAQMKGAL